MDHRFPGALAGLKSEQSALGKTFPWPVALSGARLEGARSAAQRLIQAGCTHLISYGLAGGLDPTLRPGQLLLPRTVIGPEGRSFAVDPVWHARAARLMETLDPVTSPIVASDGVLSSSADKSTLRERTLGAAVDMESHVVAEAGLPFLVLRVVADTVDLALPPAALVAVTPDGATALAQVLKSVARHPLQIPALIRLGRASSAAHRTLREAALLCGHFGFGLF